MANIDRPNRDVLDQAIGIYRDSMRPFLIRNLKQVPRHTSKKVAKTFFVFGLVLALLAVTACSPTPTIELPPRGASERLVERAEAAKERGLSLSVWSMALKAAYEWPGNPPSCQDFALAFSELDPDESGEWPTGIAQSIGEGYIELEYLFSIAPPGRESYEMLADAVTNHEQLLDSIEELLTTMEGIRDKRGCGPYQ